MEETEICVSCKKDTGVRKEDAHIYLQEVDGIGYLCGVCALEIYSPVIPEGNWRNTLEYRL